MIFPNLFILELNVFNPPHLELENSKNSSEIKLHAIRMVATNLLSLSHPKNSSALCFLQSLHFFLRP